MDNTAYYVLLGVSKDADDAAIRKGYRKVALECHPDRTQHLSDAERKLAEERFKQAAEAYNVLSDPQTRALYDRFGPGGVDPTKLKMTPEMAAEVFWNFLREDTWKANEKPSAKHGAYQATIGMVTAPVKAIALGTGVAVGGTVMGAGAVTGGVLGGVSGVMGGSYGIAKGIVNRDVETREKGAKAFAAGLAAPVAGTIVGAGMVTGGVVGGALLAGAGAVGGASNNFTEGVGEIVARSEEYKWKPVTNSNNEMAIVKRQASSEGRRLFNEALSS